MTFAGHQRAGGNGVRSVSTSDLSALLCRFETEPFDEVMIQDPRPHWRGRATALLERHSSSDWQNWCRVVQQTRLRRRNRGGGVRQSCSNRRSETNATQR